MTVPAEVNVDQTIQFAADQFEVALNDSQAFRDRVSAATLGTGLLNDALVPELVTHVSGGVVDEVELQVAGAGKMSSVVRGRDAAGFAADSTVYVTYLTGSSQTEAEEQPESIPGFPGLPVTPGVTVPARLPGPWTASRIAADLCARVGLTVAYSAPDYTLREDVVVNGPIIGAIQALVAPFSHFEPSKVDIWAEGATLVVRPRGAAGPGLTMSVHDARITDLTIKVKLLDLVRVLRLIGSKSGSSTGVAQFANRTVVTTEETIDPESGAVIMRIVTTELIRGLDNAVLTQSVDTFADAINNQGVLTRMALISRKASVSDWDDLVVEFPNKVVNQPKEHSKVTTESGFDQATGGEHTELVPMNRTSLLHRYDLTGFLTLQTTRKEVWDDTPTPFGQTGWVLDSMESKQYRDNGAGMYQITTTQHGADGVPGDVRRTTANGTRPGGPGRSSRGGGSADNLQDVTYATVISTAPGAKDVTISNRSLLAEHLAIIAGQARASSGGKEVEVACTLAGMPWIRRGQFMQLTDLFAEDGTTPIPIANSLVADARIEYREASETPTYLTFLKLVAWEAA